MLFHVLGGEPLFSGQQGEPPGAAAAGTRFRTPHEISLADDSHDLAITVDDRHGTDPVGQQEMGDILQAGVQPDGNDIGHHYIGGIHGWLPF